MGSAQLSIQLSGPSVEKLVAAISHDDENGHSTKGQLMVSNPDGSKRNVGKYLVDQSKSGRLRIARRGDQFYAMFAQQDSPHWRVVLQQTVSTQPIDVGGVQLIAVANGAGPVSVVWKDVTLRAEKLFFEPPPDQKPAADPFDFPNRRLRIAGSDSCR